VVALSAPVLRAALVQATPPPLHDDQPAGDKQAAQASQKIFAKNTMDLQ
jgi:hypothetical protein